MLYVLLGFTFLLLVSLVAAAIYMVLQKREKMLKNETAPTIHTSGMYSLVRQSPRSALEERAPSLEKISGVIDDKSKAQSYLNLWREHMEDSIQVIENGDADGLQTFCYEIPEQEKNVCVGISDNSYVTREQLQNYPQLIPPFYLGSRIKLIPKFAWNTNLDGTGWAPMLPVNGKYITPKWSTVVEL